MQYSIGKHFFAKNLQKNDSFNKLPNFQAPIIIIISIFCCMKVIWPEVRLEKPQISDDLLPLLAKGVKFSSWEWSEEEEALEVARFALIFSCHPFLVILSLYREFSSSSSSSLLVNFRHVTRFVSPCQSCDVVMAGLLMLLEWGRSHLNLTKEPLSAMYIYNYI